MQEDTGVYQVRPGVGLTLLMELDDVLCWGGGAFRDLNRGCTARSLGGGQSDPATPGSPGCRHVGADG